MKKMNKRTINSSVTVIGRCFAALPHTGMTPVEIFDYGYYALPWLGGEDQSGDWYDPDWQYEIGVYDPRLLGVFVPIDGDDYIRAGEGYALIRDGGRVYLHVVKNIPAWAAEHLAKVHVYKDGEGMSISHVKTALCRIAELSKTSYHALEIFAGALVVAEMDMDYPDFTMFNSLLKNCIMKAEAFGRIDDPEDAMAIARQFCDIAGIDQAFVEWRWGKTFEEFYEN